MSDASLIRRVAAPHGSTAEFHDDVVMLLARTVEKRVLNLEGFYVDRRFLEGFAACFWTRQSLGDSHFDAVVDALIEHHEGLNAPSWGTHTPPPWGAILRDAAHRGYAKAQETLSRLRLHWMQEGVPDAALDIAFERLVQDPTANAHVVSSLCREVKHSPALKARTLTFVESPGFAAILPEQKAMLALVLLNDSARIVDIIRQAGREWQGRLVQAWEYNRRWDKTHVIDRDFCCETLLSILPDNPEEYGRTLLIVIQTAPDTPALEHYIGKIPDEVLALPDVAREIHRMPAYRKKGQ